MIKISLFYRQFILVFILLIVVFALIRAASAQGPSEPGQEYIKIDYPTSDSPPLAGTVNVGGSVMTTTAWIGLYLFDEQTLALTDSRCALTTFPNYSCVWDTTQVANGQHLIKTAATMGGITYYSSGVVVTISNSQTLPTPTPAPAVGHSTSQTIVKIPPSPSPTPTPTSSPTPTMTTTTRPVAGRPDLTPIPVAAPAQTPTASLTPNPQEIIANSQVLATLEFKLDQDKPLHLAKIEGRQTTNKQKFLLFSGKAFADSYLKMTVKSQPLVMTVKADSSGNWQYVLEKPLEPGQHEVYIEVNQNGQVVQSGPYPFNIARAQASPDNPTGASLNLIDPQKQALKNYLYLAGGVVALAILGLVFIIYLKKIKKMRMANPPIKEPSAS
jgi:hypothetical protein